MMNKRIKALRKALHLTQVEFGKKLGVKGNTITNYETGLRNASESVIFSICREFNVNEEWLRNGTGEMFKSAATGNSIIDKIATEYALDNFQRKLVLEYLNLTPLQKDAVKAFLDKLYSSTENELTEPSKFADVSSAELIAELSKRELSSSQQKELNII